MFKKILLILTALALVSCNATKPVIVTKKGVSHKPRKEVVYKNKKYSNQEKRNVSTEVIESTSRTSVTSDLITDYIYRFKEVAINNMRNYGIPASIILAQGILESGAGRGDLAENANNHFGIKCHADWSGESVRHDDDSSQECFRKYKNPSESYRDHALFLTGRSRYSNLFSLPKGDYKAWAKGLRAAGYATDPKYPDKLISYIERYNLHQYDAQVLGSNYSPIARENTGIVSSEYQKATFYEVQKGDTFYSISKKFNLMVDELKQKNNLSENTLSIGQKLRVK